MKIQSLFLATAIVLSFTFCKKKAKQPANSTTETPSVSSDVKKEVLSDVASNVIYASYADMVTKANTLHNDLVNFKNNPTTAIHVKCQTDWKDVRSAWEQTEGFLFGPVSVENIDPRIDTWPIDFNRLDSVLASSAAFSASYVVGLEESLKGFHPIEYLLFGADGNKTTADFTARQTDFLIALSLNLQTLCEQVKTAWSAASTDNYTSKFATAGTNTTYATQRAAYEEMIDAMAGICDEVANAKLKEPFDAADPSLEESPFAKNSLNDFTNNMKSVQNVYLGKYVADGKGLEDLIKANNIAMDGTIKTKINAAITSLGNITVPFGQAISTANGQRTQVQNAITTINELKEYFEGDVKKYVQTITN